MKIIDKKDWFDKELKKLDNNLDSLTYKYVLDFSENIFEILDNNPIKNKNKYLAQKLNCSPAYISKLFNGRSNFTVRKLVELAKAVDYDLKISLIPKLIAVSITNSPVAVINIRGQLENLTSIKENEAVPYTTDSGLKKLPQETLAA